MIIVCSNIIKTTWFVFLRSIVSFEYQGPMGIRTECVATKSRHTHTHTHTHSNTRRWYVPVRITFKPFSYEKTFLKNRFTNRHRFLYAHARLLTVLVLVYVLLYARYLTKLAPWTGIKFLPNSLLLAFSITSKEPPSFVWIHKKYKYKIYSFKLPSPFPPNTF